MRNLEEIRTAITMAYDVTTQKLDNGNLLGQKTALSAFEIVLQHILDEGFKE